MGALDTLFSELVDYAWGMPLIVVLLGGGFVLLALSRFLPFLGLRHAIDILRGKFDHEDDPGDITHFQALATALSSTIGMGNIAGVAVAITQGGPGAVFWMWRAAIVGMATKFFTCTLAVM
jgi:alanine or glycine:cation symporter, AGCS family